MDELKPCPFCGGEPEAGEDLGDYWVIQCMDTGNNCGARTHPWTTKDAAIQAWNRRAEQGDKT